jgi:hypothetical protein
VAAGRAKEWQRERRELAKRETERVKEGADSEAAKGPGGVCRGRSGPARQATLVLRSRHRVVGLLAREEPRGLVHLERHKTNSMASEAAQFGSRERAAW